MHFRVVPLHLMSLSHLIGFARVMVATALLVVVATAPLLGPMLLTVFVAVVGRLRPRALLMVIRTFPFFFSMTLSVLRAVPPRLTAAPLALRNLTLLGTVPLLSPNDRLSPLLLYMMMGNAWVLAQLIPSIPMLLRAALSVMGSLHRVVVVLSALLVCMSRPLLGPMMLVMAVAVIRLVLLGLFPLFPVFCGRLNVSAVLLVVLWAVAMAVLLLAVRAWVAMLVTWSLCGTLRTRSTLFVLLADTSVDVLREGPMAPVFMLTTSSLCGMLITSAQLFPSLVRSTSVAVGPPGLRAAVLVSAMFVLCGTDRLRTCRRLSLCSEDAVGRPGLRAAAPLLATCVLVTIRPVVVIVPPVLATVPPMWTTVVLLLVTSRLRWARSLRFRASLVLYMVCLMMFPKPWE